MNTQKQVSITINSHINVSRKALPESVQNILIDRLIFANPKWLANEKMGYWNGNTEEKLYFLEDHDGTFIMPRGFINQLCFILNQQGISYKLIDNTRELPEVDFQFQGSLYDFQNRAAQAILKRRFGIFNCPTGGGKTVVALYCIAQRKQPALVVIHTKELLYQWRDRAVEFLGITCEEIGLIGDGHKNIGEKLTLSIVNSLYKCTDEVSQHIGHLIVDECHRTPSRTFIDAVSAFDCRYMLGLSATPYRRDQLTQVIYFYMGIQLYNIEHKELQSKDKIMRARLVVCKTYFKYDYKGPDDYQPMLTFLTEDFKRNQQITNDVLKYVQKNNGIALVVSDRKEHCNTLYDLIKESNSSIRLLTGDVPNSKRKKIVKELNNGKVRILVATSQLIGEGFDLKTLSALFLGTPVKFTGRIKQYAGRILRTDKGKEEAVIYDYVDLPGVLQASFKSRLSAYNQLGIKDIRGLSKKIPLNSSLKKET
ncbi:ATP-dependent DNA helicase UvsW [Candidatus Magnetomoraceae bacterium gMMP-13]